METVKLSAKEFVKLRDARQLPDKMIQITDPQNLARASGVGGAAKAEKKTEKKKKQPKKKKADEQAKLAAADTTKPEITVSKEDYEHLRSVGMLKDKRANFKVAE